MPVDVVRVVVVEHDSVMRVISPSASVGSAGVTSVNGQIGIVLLGYTEVGAAPLIHSHTISGVTNLQATLDGKASLTHSHAISDVTGLQAALNTIPVDAGLVHLSGSETISGTKTFTAAPLYAADPSGGNELTRKSWVEARLAAVVGGAPGALDTLNELAAALGNDSSFATTITNALALKANSSSLAAVATAGTYSSLTGKPTLGTSSPLDVPSSGDATSGQVVKGSDSRLTNARTPSAHASSHSAIGSDPVSLTAAQVSGLSTVATTGAYSDLSGKPTLFDGTWTSLSGKPTFATVATTGVYSDLSGKPTLFDGVYSSLSGKPVLFDGTWVSLSGKPTFATVSTTGVYSDLTGRPSLATVATTGVYADLTGKPTLFDGTWTSLSGKPAFATVATTGVYSDLTSKPTLGTSSPLDVPSSGDATSGQVVKGSDTRLTDSRKARSIVSLGGIATLAQKTYSAKIPCSQAFLVNELIIACGTAGGANVNFQLVKNGSNWGSAQTFTAGNVYQKFTLGYTGSADDVIQIAVTSAVGGTPPANVTVSLNWTVG